MATYEYRCTRDGVFEVFRPIGSAPDSVHCTICDTPAKRIFSAPFLYRGSRELVAAMDRAEKSRSEPEVVNSVPSAGQRRPPRMAPNDPRLQRLPRP